MQGRVLPAMAGRARPTTACKLSRIFHKNANTPCRSGLDRDSVATAPLALFAAEAAPTNGNVVFMKRSGYKHDVSLFMILDTRINGVCPIASLKLTA